MNRDKQAHSVSEFLSRVAEIRDEFAFDADPFEPWFRGHQRAYWSLCPKLYRDYGKHRPTLRKVENETREEFIVRAPIYLESSQSVVDDWEWYFLMQHFRAPTRLLDWTEGSLLALYFAVKDNAGLYDAAVWALDPYELNRIAINRTEVIPPSATGLHADARRVRRWLPKRFQKNVTLPDKPLAVLPTHSARRISTQRSCFTVHGKDFCGLDRLVERTDDPVLVKIVIPSFSVLGIHRELQASGIDETTIFPDLEGLGRSLCAKWRLGFDLSHDVHKNVNTRLRPSRIHGVGVFAIRAIKKDVPLFADDHEEMLWMDESEVPRAPAGIRKLYDDFCVVKDKRYGCPQNFNRLTMSWYLNEPAKGDRPNVRCDQNSYDFFALKDIKAGEELTVDYAPYSERPARR